ncbi:MAG: hypothetical protein IV103_20755 [Zoogloea sp.]|nr:hypothetical protein [Zoogloea sp.]
MFTTDFSNYPLVGFHATSISACESIQAVGFLPNKIFSREEHDRLISIAQSQNIVTSTHEEWLTMYSVTFTKDKADAQNHIKQGSAGGQGLMNITGILDRISGLSNNNDAIFVAMLQQKIEAIQSAGTVIYAVDLSNLGLRLDTDRHRPLYYYRWNPAEPLPEASEISPSRIIEKITIPAAGISK